MADTKVTDLAVTTSPLSSDILYVISGDISKQTTIGNVGKGILVTNLDVTGLTASQLLRVNSGSSAIESAGVTLSGADATVITGTAGTDGNLTKWNADGDVVDGPTPPSGTIVGTTDTQTLSAKTLTSPTINSPALSADSVDAITEIKSTLKSGSDAKLITGTAGTDGDLAKWNADGDLVDGPTPPSGTILGTTDTQTQTNKRITKRVTTIASSATPTVNTDNCDVVTITALAAAITSMTTNLTGTPTNFQTLIFRILDNATGRAITWGAKFEPRGVALPTTTTASKLLTVGFIYDTVDDIWGCVASADEA